jgi:hypothetical protein
MPNKPVPKSVPKPVPQPRAKTAAKRAPRQAAAVAVAPAAPAVAPKPPKAKAKLVRDSFTMPAADFALIALLKDRALVFQRPAKKSELLRAGLQVLQALDDSKLRKALDALVPLKPGRPKRGD